MPKGERQTFRYRFGRDEQAGLCEFSESRLELRVAGALRRGVQPLPLKVLGHLLRHANEFVSPDSLLQEVWPTASIERRAVYNAIDKLRDALGREGAAALIENGRGGYRFKGSIYARHPEAPTLEGAGAPREGDAVPWREGFRFVEKLGGGHGSHVWLARHRETGDERVLKFCTDAGRLMDLRKEVALALLLRDRLGQRDDFVEVLHWEFDQAPQFVELAHGGMDLGRWAEEDGRLAALPAAQRLQLAQAVVDAISAAHGAGVVHMDLKPSNVLVARGMAGSPWQIRVVDFGSGRSLDRAAIERLGVQRLGLSVTQVVEGTPTSGTVDYMAPEVRRGAEQVLPVLCDVYALGVLLYQLLAGDLHKPLAPGWERDIEDPFLRDDIAAATDGEPGRRLPGAGALAQRLKELEARRSRHAGEQALLREAQANRDRRRQLEARQPWVVATILLLVAGLGMTALSWRRAEAARADAQASAARAEAVTRFLDEDVLGMADPYGAAPPDPALRAALKRALDRAGQAFSGQPRTEAAVRVTLADLVDKYDNPGAAESQWRAAAALLTDLDGSAAPGTLAVRYRAGVVMARAGHFDQALAWLKQAEDDRARALPNDSRTALQAEHAWGLYHLTRQQLDLAAAPFERALQIAATSAPPPESALLDSIRHGLVTAYSGLGRFEDSARVARQQLESLESRSTASDLRVAAARYDLGQALLYQGELDAAEPLLDAAAQVVDDRLGRGSPSAVMMQTTRCELRIRRHQVERALECIDGLYRAQLDSPTTPRWMAWLTLSNAGLLQMELGRTTEALQSQERALKGVLDAHGPDAVTQFVRFGLAEARWRGGQAASAAPLLEGLDPTVLQSVEPDAPWLQRLSLLRGLVLASTGRPQQARALLAPVVDALTTSQASSAGQEPERLLEDARRLLAARP